MEQFILSLTTFVAIVFPVVGLITTIMLVRAARSDDGRGIGALRERAAVSIVLLIGSLCGWALGVHRIIAVSTGSGPLPSSVIIVLLCTLLITVNIPSLIWLWMYYRRK